MKKLALLLVALLLWPLACRAEVEPRLRWTMPEQATLGQPFVLEVKSNQDIAPLTLGWQGQEYRLNGRNGTYRTLLGTGLDDSLVDKKLPVELRFRFGGRDRTLTRLVTITGRQYPTERLTVAPSMASPPQSELDRIARELKASQAALATVSPGKVLKLPLQLPLPGITVTSSFGRSRVFNGTTQSLHTAMDLRAPLGTPVRALTDGRVVLTGDFYYAGRCVYLDHGAGLVSYYFHLSEIKVKEGDQVQAGDLLGLSGMTGRVTGPHLHLGLSLSGHAMDPGPAIGVGSFVQGVERVYRLEDL